MPAAGVNSTLRGAAWAVVLSLSAGSAIAAAAAPPRLERTNLLAFQNAAGEIVPVKSVADWQGRRAAILAAMQEIMGPLPGAAKRCPLEPRVESEEDGGDFVRRRISYQAEPGGRVPAYLLVPKGALSGGRQFPAALALHQTRALGHKIVVGLGHSTNDEYGVELARRGYVVLAPPYPLLADYHPDLQQLDYASGTMKAIWDNSRGLDYLSSLPFVRTNGFGAIGHSLGGHNAVYTAVFDERIKVVASSCGLDSYRDYYDGDPKVWQPERGWCQTRYLPRLLAYRDRLADIPFDFHELVGALAPRACFLSAPLGDTNFKWRSVDAIARAARPVFALHGVPQNLVVEHPDCGHLFPSAMREQAYRLFDAHLR